MLSPSASVARRIQTRATLCYQLERPLDATVHSIADLALCVESLGVTAGV